MKLWDFPDISQFPKLLSFKSFGNAWGNSYIPVYYWCFVSLVVKRKFAQPSKSLKILWPWFWAFKILNLALDRKCSYRSTTENYDKIFCFLNYSMTLEKVDCCNSNVIYKSIVFSIETIFRYLNIYLYHLEHKLKSLLNIVSFSVTYKKFGSGMLFQLKYCETSFF